MAPKESQEGKEKKSEMESRLLWLMGNYQINRLIAVRFNRSTNEGVAFPAHHSIDPIPGDEIG